MSTWMIVEDEPDLFDLLLLMAEALAHEGVAFLNGEEAVRWIDDFDQHRIRAHRPDYALIDVRLPGPIQGDGVSSRLRESAILKDIPIILMTAYRLNAEEEREMLRRSGASILIYKPLPSPNELQALFQKLDAARRPENGGAARGEATQ